VAGCIKDDTRRLAILFAVIYGVMGASGIVSQALNGLMKDGLALSASRAAIFSAVATGPTYFGPLYGLLSDAVPLFGSRRKSYLVLCGIVGAAAWGMLGVTRAPTYVTALVFLAAALLTMEMSVIVANGLMVDAGKPTGMTGVFQSVQWGAANAASLLGTLGSGYLVERFSGAAAFRLYALFPLAAACASAVLLREPPVPPRAGGGRELQAALRGMVSSRAQWAVTLFLFAWFFSPGLGTALYYFQRDSLHFGPGLIGVLGAVFAGAGLPAAALYARLSRRLPIRRLVGTSVLLGTLGHLSYLAMDGPKTALLACAVDGALSMFAMLAVFDIGARAAPEKVEGTAFSILTSARIAAALTGGIAGGALYDMVGLRVLILISATFTAACGLLVRLLPEPDRIPLRPVGAVAQMSS
jgi:MFS family permease